MRERFFVDTWGWVALGHKKDSHHKEVARFYREVHQRGAEIVTSDYVLDELITLLFRRGNRSEALDFIEGLLASVDQGHIKVAKITPGTFEKAWDLRRRFRQYPFISFTDLTSMVVMNERDILRILTEDRHFFQVGMGFQKIP
jgi:predicted nucleic acid-binding protein